MSVRPLYHVRRRLVERGARLGRRRRWPVIGRGALRTQREQSVFDTLRHTNLAVRSIREGLDERTAGRTARALLDLLEVAGVAISGDDRLLAVVGEGGHHGLDDDPIWEIAETAMRTGRSRSSREGFICDQHLCPVGEAVAVPIMTGDTAQGAIVILRARGRRVTLGLLRSAFEVARQMGTQLELADVDTTREALVAARTKALRAQMSPHFVYNTLTATASLVRTNPEKARELLVGFAEFSRYILRNDRVNTTLQDELANIYTYVELEKARHGSRLEVKFRVGPEVLAVTIPTLILQPLVENAIVHGVERTEGQGVVKVMAEDRDDDVFIAVSDNGAGMTPDLVDAIRTGTLTPDARGNGVALRNIQDRLAATYGEHYRLGIDSTPGEGTTISMRVPKYRAGVRA